MLFSGVVQAASPLQAALLVQQIGVLNLDEIYLAGFLAQHEITYDAVDAEMIRNGTVDLSKYNVLYLRTGSVPKSYQDPEVLSKLKDRVASGANLFLENFGAYLGQYLGVTQVLPSPLRWTFAVPEGLIQHRIIPPHEKPLGFVRQGKGKIVPLDLGKEEKDGGDGRSIRFRRNSGCWK